MKVVIIIILVISFVIINIKIKERRNSTFSFARDSSSYAYDIESMSFVDDELVIEGWFVKLQRVKNIPIDVNNNEVLGILLYDINQEEEYNIDGETKPPRGYLLSVEHIKRPDINNYLKCEYDYSDCGFVARINMDDLDIDNGEYQIIFKIDSEKNLGEGIQSSYFIKKGELTHINPKENYELEANNTDLEKIILEGDCLVSDDTDHIFVFQYDRKLYWIADEEYYFEEDGSTYIQYHLYTTQYDKLLTEKNENKYYGDMSFDFEAYELTQKINCGKYRVCVREIPKDYSVYWINTGYYVNDWVWLKSFRPTSK